jgi:hydrogenase maturation protease
MTGAGRWLVIGVGNRDRGDDAAGPVVCDLLTRGGVGAAAGLPVDVIVAEGSIIDLSTHWAVLDHVTIVDASEPAGRPGKIVETDALDCRLRSPGTISTHSIDVGAAIELGRVLGRLPVALTVIGIEGCNFEFGAPMTDAVRRATERVASRIIRHAMSPTGHVSFDGAS